MIKEGIETLNYINQEFRKKAKLNDIIVLIFLMVIPFFLTYTIIWIFVLSNVGLVYMVSVINRAELIFS